MYSTCIVHMYYMHMFVHTIVHVFCGYLRSLFRIFITDCQATIVLLLLYYYYYFRTIKDGEETVITLENGKMVSKRINGVEQLAIKWVCITVSSETLTCPFINTGDDVIIASTHNLLSNIELFAG